MITEAQRAEIRRLFYAEHWRIGTIASELGLHTTTVRVALETARFNRNRLTNPILSARGVSARVIPHVYGGMGSVEGKRSPRWSIAEASAALADQECSGLSIAAFCQSRGWHSERLYRWKRRLAARAATQSADVTSVAPSFVRAEVRVPTVAPAAASASPVARFELVLCSGQRLCFSADVDPVALARTVQVLEADRC